MHARIAACWATRSLPLAPRSAQGRPCRSSTAQGLSYRFNLSFTFQPDGFAMRSPAGRAAVEKRQLLVIPCERPAQQPEEDRYAAETKVGATEGRHTSRGRG